MKIVQQSVICLQSTVDPERFIEACGRTAYQSEGSIAEDSYISFIEKILKLGHESVIEHASATFRIITDRGISHELVRHRIASYTQESTRYCRYENEIVVICPPDGLNNEQYNQWLDVCQAADENYQYMLNGGISPQIARSVLPTTCLNTEIVMTDNFREWRHFLKLRLAPTAHPQMRELAGIIRDKLIQIAPVVFGEFCVKN